MKRETLEAIAAFTVLVATLVSAYGFLYMLGQLMGGTP